MKTEGLVTAQAAVTTFGGLGALARLRAGRGGPFIIVWKNDTFIKW